jgi:hypothetical protein
LTPAYSIREVAERLGHDPATLLRYYSRVNAVRRRQAAHQIADLIALGDTVVKPEAVCQPLAPA